MRNTSAMSIALSTIGGRTVAGAAGIAGIFGNTFLSCFGRVEFTPSPLIVAVLLVLAVVAVAVCLEAAFYKTSFTGSKGWGLVGIVGAGGVLLNTALAFVNWWGYAQPSWVVIIWLVLGLVAFMTCLWSAVSHFDQKKGGI